MKRHKDWLHTLVFSPTGKTLVSSCAGGEIKLWQVYRGLEKATWKGAKEGVFCLAFHPNGKLLASLSSDNMIKLWNLKNTKGSCSAVPGSGRDF